MNQATRDLVRRRAGNRFEYCRIHQNDDPVWPFHVEHIVARQHHQSDHPDGLALACHECNSRKGPNLGGIDPLTGKKAWLFNPRMQKWKRHFQWRGAVLMGRTACGRATIAVLGINLPENVALRAMLIKAGVFPVED
jgi:hypothetical protein